MRIPSIGVSVEIPDNPEVQAAWLRCVVASFKWANAAHIFGGYLPVPGSTPSAEELEWNDAVRHFANAANIPIDEAEAHALVSYQGMRHELDIIHALQPSCNNHLPITDFCHGTFGDAFMVLHEAGGMSRSDFLAFVNARYQLEPRSCSGFAASKAALAGCTYSPAG